MVKTTLTPSFATILTKIKFAQQHCNFFRISPKTSRKNWK